MIHHILPIGFSAIDRRPTVRRPLDEVVHYDRYDESKYMSNQQGGAPSSTPSKSRAYCGCGIQGLSSG
jgi:hypothetical protein